MRGYRLAIKPGEAGEVYAAGNYVRLNSADIGLEVTLFEPSSGSEVVMQAGDAVRLREFTYLRVTHNSPVEKVVTIYVGLDTRIDSSRVAGVVEVVSGEMARVKDGVAFIQPNTQVATAAAYSACQIFNPGGSGLNLFINSVAIMASAAGSAGEMRSHNVALAEAIGAGKSKKIGGADSIALGYRGALPGTLGVGLLSLGLGQAFESKTVPFTEPVMLPPGYGLIVNLTTVNVSLWATFQWLEEQI